MASSTYFFFLLPGIFDKYIYLSSPVWISLKVEPRQEVLGRHSVQKATIVLNLDHVAVREVLG